MTPALPDDRAGLETWRSDQMRDLDPEVESYAGFTLRTTFHRSRECQGQNQPAQDYMTYAVSPGAVWWAVADGVSESFFGDVAARVAAEVVLAWLAQVSLEAADVEQLESGLRRALAEAVGPGQRAVEAVELPPSLHPAFRDALERKRVAGSETMISCGRIERGPGGTSLFVASLGDMRTRWDSHAGRGELPRDTANRWSSRLGVKGPVTCHLARGVSQLHVRAYSDGLAAIDDRIELTSAELDEAIARAKSAPNSDDICLFEAWDQFPADLEASIPRPHPELTYTPAGVKVGWSAVPGATHYVVEVSGRETVLFQVSGCRWMGTGLAPGEYRLRVHGVAQRTGTRSETHRFVVPEPAAARLDHPVRRAAPDVASGETPEAVLGALVEAGYRLAYELLGSYEDAVEAVRRAARRALPVVDPTGPAIAQVPWFLGLVTRQCRRGRWRRRLRRILAMGRGEVVTPSLGAVIGRALHRDQRRLSAGALRLGVLLEASGLPHWQVAQALAVATGRDEMVLRDLVSERSSASRPPAGLREWILADMGRPARSQAVLARRWSPTMLAITVLAFIVVVATGALFLSVVFSWTPGVPSSHATAAPGVPAAPPPTSISSGPPNRPAPPPARASGQRV